MSRLSKSKHPAYQLRPNKAVDRLLFVEIIRALEHYFPLVKHVYVGFAGPFLEDFRIISHAFPKLRLISVEIDEETYKRQKFHMCSRKLKLHKSKFKEFLSTDFPLGPTISWIDYTDMNRGCLLEVSDIARKAIQTSLLRVTVKAETPVYRELNLRRKWPNLPKEKRKSFDRFLRDFRSKMTIEGIAYDDSLFVYENFRERDYPSLLMQMLVSVIEGSCSHPKVFLPLQASKYSDGTIMLSVTGVFCTVDTREEVRSHFEQQKVLKSGMKLEMEVIDVPVLTTKERLHLDSLLPSSDESGMSSLKKLGYLVEGDGSQGLSKYKMKQYEKYYRFYPFFGKLVP